MLVILIAAFFKYDQFSIIDITSFAVFTFAGFLILFLVIYLIVLRTVTKKITYKQFIYFPLLFALLANIPAYIVIWINTPELYGSGEATLFTIGILTSGLVFGLFRAWKNKMLSSMKRI
jgi:hypothetical protein